MILTKVFIRHVSKNASRHFSEDCYINVLENSLRIPVELSPKAILRIPPMINSGVTLNYSFKNSYKNTIKIFFGKLSKDFKKNNYSKDSTRNFKKKNIQEFLEGFF